MGIVEIVEDELQENYGEEIVKLLNFYEQSYPPDLALDVVDGVSSLLDFDIRGGDIAVSGFSRAMDVKTLFQRAIQDLLMRLFIEEGSSRLLPNFGLGPLETLPRELIEPVIIIAGQQSPFIRSVNSVRITDGGSVNGDSIRAEISITTVSGDNLARGFNIRT